MFCGWTAKIIFASIFSSITKLARSIQRAHSGFILYDILNACSAIFLVTFFNPFNIIIFLGTSCIKYFSYFLFLFTQHISDTRAKVLALSSNCLKFIPILGNKARPEFRYTTFLILTLADRITFAFF